MKLEKDLSKVGNLQKKLKTDEPEENLSELGDSNSTTNFQKITKRRRVLVEKSFKCEFDKCEKEYCSIDALALHVKRKHPDSFNGFSLRRRDIRREVSDKIQRDAQLAVSIFSGSKKNDEESCTHFDCEKSMGSWKQSTRGSAGTESAKILSEFDDQNEKMYGDGVLDVVFTDTSMSRGFYAY